MVPFLATTTSITISALFLSLSAITPTLALPHDPSSLQPRADDPNAAKPFVCNHNTPYLVNLNIARDGPLLTLPQYYLLNSLGALIDQPPHRDEALTFPISIDTGNAFVGIQPGANLPPENEILRTHAAQCVDEIFDFYQGLKPEERRGGSWWIFVPSEGVHLAEGKLVVRGPRAGAEGARIEGGGAVKGVADGVNA